MAIAPASSSPHPSDTRPTSAALDLARFEADLWHAADDLRANSKLTSSDYFMPVLGVIFLRHAANRFAAAQRQIEADQAAGRMPRRKLRPADFVARRALWLPEEARYDWIMQQASLGGADLPRLVGEAMAAIERDFEPLLGVLPKEDYGRFEPGVLENLLRLFNSEVVKQASGDVFGRIYEYFLAKFSVQKAHDNGEFFTPSPLVQLIVNVIEPDHGTVFDPACGSGGMFVQSSHFIADAGGDAVQRTAFYGQEKNRDTIRLAQMNLAVHGLEGHIAEAITYYEDAHTLVGGCDFVMANPPFNVDLVDATKVEGDPRLPFGLPGVNKQKKVSNANYLWISYFWSYLNERGRAGFVMSSQASSAGHTERDVRRKLVESGDVDVMISIRANFFYSRSVPCELWHLDRGKPPARRDVVLMLDARQVFRKVNRKINDFSPEQLRNLTAIVWLYRGQSDRFLALVGDYLDRVAAESAAVPAALAPFDATLADLRQRFAALAAVAETSDLDAERHRALADAARELTEAEALYAADADRLREALQAFARRHAEAPPATNDAQRAARSAFDPHAEAIRGLVKQIDLLYKLAARLADLGADAAGIDAVSTAYDRRAAARLVKQLDDLRHAAAEQLRHAAYLHRQVAWLQDRFPQAALADVPGLVKLVTSAEIAAADWSLTPGRYVGVAPAEEDDDFDFEQTLRDIHAELGELNRDAAALAEAIQRNLEGLTG